MTNHDACPECGGNLCRWTEPVVLRCTSHSRHIFTPDGAPVELVAA